jgi:hypothetical protein
LEILLIAAGIVILFVIVPKIKKKIKNVMKKQ